MVCCAENVVRCEILGVALWWWAVECITFPLHRAPRHITATFYIASFHIKHHLWHSRPHHSDPHHTIIPHSRTFHITRYLQQHTAIPLCNTIFEIAPYRPHYAWHWHFASCTPLCNTIFEIAPYRPHYAWHWHFASCTPLCNTIFEISRTISATLCMTLTFRILHPISRYVPHNRATFTWPYIVATSFMPIAPPHLGIAQHCTAFHILHILHHSTTSDTVWSHLIPHPTSVHHHFLHLA